MNQKDFLKYGKESRNLDDGFQITSNSFIRKTRVSERE